MNVLVDHIPPYQKTLKNHLTRRRRVRAFYVLAARGGCGDFAYCGSSDSLGMAGSGARGGFGAGFGQPILPPLPPDASVELGCVGCGVAGAGSIGLTGT